MGIKRMQFHPNRSSLKSYFKGTTINFISGLIIYYITFWIFVCLIPILNSNPIVEITKYGHMSVLIFNFIIIMIIIVNYSRKNTRFRSSISYLPY